MDDTRSTTFEVFSYLSPTWQVVTKGDGVACVSSIEFFSTSYSLTYTNKVKLKKFMDNVTIYVSGMSYSLGNYKNLPFWLIVNLKRSS